MNSNFVLLASYMTWDFKSLLLFAVVFIIAADFVKNRRPLGFPPGPWALPIVGNIFSVGHNRTHERLTQLAEKYGNVYSLRIGQKWTVVLNGFEVLKGALVTQGDSLADQPLTPLSVDRSQGLGVISTSGHIWRQQRRFALSTLRYFGFGKKSLEPVILDEFTHCAEVFRSYKGKPFNPRLTTMNVTANIICSLVFGHRFEYSDEKFRKLIWNFGESLHFQTTIWAETLPGADIMAPNITGIQKPLHHNKLYNAFPVLMRYFPGLQQKLQKNWAGVKGLIREEINEHKQISSEQRRDYIDCYLNEIQMNKGKDDNTFDEENLLNCVWDLFVAGSDTTSTTLRWAFLYMVKYPEIQEKVQAEIDGVIGQSRHPSMEDRANLPYTDAVIHEIQRMGNIAPLGVPRFTNRVIQLGGYTIPKGVTIIPNLTSVMFDKNEWETPFTFNPGHFLNEEGKFMKPPAFIPFSAGKRLCLGENLAKMELFLFFTSFMQHFTFSMPAGVKPSMEYRLGVTLAPKEYEICVTSRVGGQ